LSYDRIDKLYNGMQVYTYGFRGDWVAIVYSGKGRWTEVCNVSTPWSRTMPYTRSMQVHRRWIEMIAG
jgi:hypothetical protein